MLYACFHLPMRNLKLTLEYDGTSFFGFQRQPHHPTIQEALEKALSKLLNRKTKIAAASGRTDTGVHAEGQVVNFKTKNKMPAAQIQKALNAILPREIAVRKIEEVPDAFHARYSAKSKTYEYRIWNDLVRSPLMRAHAYFVSTPLDFVRMKQGAKLLTGKHDFCSFCSASGVVRENTVRTLKRFQVTKKGPLIRIQVEADGFLYHMVRNLAGSLIELGQKKISLQDLKKIIVAKDRRKAGGMVPARGLVLIGVNYK